MLIICPKCKRQQFELNKTVCPRCGFQLTVPELRRLYRRRWRLYRRLCRLYRRRLLARLRGKAAVECPHCGNAVPLLAKACAACGSPLTVGDVVESSLGPTQQQLERLLSNPPRPVIKAFRWLYLLVSVALLWWLVVHLDLGNWPKLLSCAALSIVYVAVLALLSAWIVPRHIFGAIAQHTPRIVRVSLVFNFLASLMLLQVLIAAWWVEALILAALFVTTWFGAVILCRLLWPIVVEGGEIYKGTESFDVSKPQGRKVVND